MEKIFAAVKFAKAMVKRIVGERKQLLSAYHQEYHHYPKEKYIHELFEDKVREIPNQIAIIYKNQKITYDDLNKRSNQLARYLQSLEIETEDRVSVALPRGVELIVALFAILKAGGAYVPMDIDSPKDRMAYMLNDSNAKLLLCFKNLKVPENYLGKVVYLDDKETYQQWPTTNLNLSMSSKNLAYVTYTSGSTGRPKGVACHHQGVINRLYWAWNNYPFKKDEICALQSSMAFVDSTWDIFGTLLMGAKLVLYNESISRNIEELLQTCLAQKVTRITLIPSFLNTMLDFSASQLSKYTKYFYHWEITGESFKPSLIDNFFKHVEHATLLDCYGATEATSVIYRDYIEKNGTSYKTKIISNTQVYLLDSHLNIVPLGAEGEIYIGGVGLARGYLNQPGLTAERFIPNPFEEGGRLYKTGDLARFLPDGNIEFLGRIDHQIKIRGFRVELGEIEATIESNDQVQQAIVICREDAPQQKRLVAYIVLRKREDIKTEAQQEILESLENLCRSRLPDYMQPSRWLILDSFPLTQTGKIDRKALPAPEGREGLGAYKPPEGQLEEQLASLWSELLGVKVSRNDDFFRLGGHSLLATQMVSRLRKALKQEIPLRVVFECRILCDLARYLKQSHLNEGILPVITRAPRDKYHTLSFAQQRLWFIEQLLPNTDLYHNPIRVKISGGLNISALRQSLNALVARHEILRTVIINSDGVALQQILAEDTGFNLQETENENSKDIELFIKKPFRFDREPLCRGLLVKHSQQDHVLILVFHHMIIDDWSVGIFFNELNTFYKAYTEGKRVSLQPLSVQYVDYTVWQRTWLTEEILEKQLGFWKDQLSEISTLELPYDYPRPQELSYQGGRVVRKLSKELLEQLQAFTKSQGVTLFMSVLASVQGFLNRYCNQRDIALGTPIAHRRVSETESLIGFFVNTLVIRNQLEDNLNFKTFVNQVKDTTISAYDQQDVPFEQLVEFLQVPRELNRNPLFQVMFNLQYEGEKFDLGECSVQFEENQNQLSRFDLLISVFIGKNGIRLIFDYAKDLFKEERVKQIAEYYETFLQAILNEPDKRMLEISIIGNEERQQLFHWNATQQTYSRDKCIHQLIEEQVEKTPTRIAVEHEGREITYREMNEKANQLARYLRKNDIGPDKIVLVALERSIEMVVAILGVLKAGGVYVPMDPSYPEERLIFMLEDTGAPLLITQDSLKEVFMGYNKILYMDGNWNEIQQEDKSNLHSITHPNHLAYIIYTSGSTGKPKGVMIEQQNLTHYITFAKNTYPLTPGMSLFHGSFAFDMSITALFLPLVQGFAVCMVSEGIDVESLGEFIKKRRDLNVIKLTPTHLKALKEQLNESDIQQQKAALIIGGEKLSAKDLGYWKHSSLQRYIVNEYGPTETTVGCCIYPIENINTEISIGHPIANTQIFLLNNSMEMVPVGVVGEIYIGGWGLARGYWNRPDLTAERFLPNPFEANTRLYKTGDLGRYLPDGNIEYIGRSDEQVKIKGYRIEPGEIIAALLKHEDVLQAAVVAKDHESGIKKLIAYVVPGEFKPSATELREYLEQRLPEYMVPSFFILIDKIPLTLNGKLDYKALPAPESFSRLLQDEFVSPSNERERTLCEIWCSVLGIDQVGIRDHFFRIGGDSIISIQLVSKARQIGIRFSVKDVFNHPTIEALAVKSEENEQLERSQVSSVANNKIETDFRQILLDNKFLKKNFINESLLEDAYPLSPLQAGLLFQALYEPDSDVYLVQSVLKLEGRVNKEVLQNAWQKVCDHHEILRTGIAWEELDKPLQYVLSKVEVPFEVFNDNIGKKWHSTSDLEQFITVCLETDRQQRFDLRQAPLFRIKLLDFGNGSIYMIWSSHHIISDGWSNSLILADVLKAYEGLIKGQQISFKPHLHYKEYIDWLERQDKEKAREYWQDTLSSVDGPTRLSFNKIRQNLPLHKDYAAHEVELSAEETENVQRLASDKRVTINTVLQGAVGILLQHYTQKTEVVMGVTISGRTIDLPEVEEMVGLFINTLPLKINYHPTDTVESYLSRIQQQTQQLSEFSDTPLSQIYSWTSQHQGLFEVLFVFENYPVQAEVKEGGQSFKISNIKAFERTEYPLTIVVVIDKNINFIFRYQTDHFDEATIELIAQHLNTLLQNMRTSNDNPQTLTYLSQNEYHQITKTWNDTFHQYAHHKTIQQLFEEQVGRTPNNIALIYDEQEITYHELNAQVNQLAHFLRELGVCPDKLVAVAIDRSLEMLICLLAILKAGGAYVPLDPSYPEERLMFMLEDTQASLLITQPDLKINFATYKGKILLSNEIRNLTQHKSKENLKSLNLPQDLVYIIYTSGSTGKPKGVMISHEGFFNRLLWMKEKYNLTEKDRVLHKTPFTFDVSVWELFLPLITGSTEIIARPGVHKDPNLIWDLINKKSVTVCHFVPPMLAAFLGSNKYFENNSLRITVTSGDVLSKEVVDEFYVKLNGELHNLYGPTEASIDVTSHECLPNYHSIPPIGKPIWNTQIYILDAKLNPVATGIVGELYIGGIGLARGYLNRPQLTAERFIPNPFNNDNSDRFNQNLRLYRTGDLARYLPSGTIEFLGRIDDQVKIRGYRIELGEIETTLVHHQRIRQAVVIAKEIQPMQKKLVAYIVPKELPIKTFTRDLIEDVKAYVNSILPEYMVPTFFVCIPEIPLTSNGKVDRKALPPPESDLESFHRENLTPRNEMESVLCDVWKDVLGVEQIGIQDNFFGLGGDSIVSIQLVSKARQKGIDFSVKDVFDHPTIESLASVARNKLDDYRLQQNNVEGELALTPIQHWFFKQNPTVPHHFNQVMWLKSKEQIDLNKLQAALKKLYHRHDSFRLRYKKEEKGWKQYYVEEVSVPWGVYPNLEEENLENVCTELQSSLDIERGPISQLLWFEEKKQLLWVIHHLIVDSVSWRILLDDLNLAYEGKDLGSKSHSFKDWSHSLTLYSSEPEIRYYQTQLQTIPRLPKDYEYSDPIILKDTKRISISFSPHITKLFLQKAHRSYGTEPYDLLLLALTLSVGDCFGKYQLCVDLEGHGREDLGHDLDLTRTIGWFTSVHPVILNVPNPSDLDHSIKHIKEHLRSIPQKGVSFGILSHIQKKFEPVQADVLFNYLGQWSTNERNKETFFFTKDVTGFSSSLENSHTHSLILNGEINQGQLDFQCSYSTFNYKTSTIEKLLETFKKRLENLIEYCSEEKNFGFSPSDFPYVKLKGKQLDNLFKKMESENNV